MQLRPFIFSSLLCLIATSLFGQNAVEVPIYEPGRIQYGGQAGATWFVPTGFLRLEKEVSDSERQLYEEVSARYGTGIQVGGTFGFRVSRHFSFLQELNLSRTNRTMSFNYGYANLNQQEENYFGKGRLDIVSHYLQSFSAFQYSTLGQVALGVQLGIGFNGRLYDQLTGLAEPGNVPAFFVSNWKDLPEVAEEGMAVPFFTDLAAGFFVRFRMENQEFKLTLRRNIHELGNLFDANGRGSYPRTSSLTLTWLIHQPKSDQ